MNSPDSQLLQELLDREAIRDHIARYGPAADSGDADGVAALFDEAGVYAVGGMGEVKQVRSFGVVESQRPGERVEHRW